MRVINVIDRCPYPGGRYIVDGPYSGEFFRENVLRPELASAIASKQQLKVILDGAPGYGSSFLEESFGGLVRTAAFSKSDLAKWLIVAADDPLFETYRSLAERYIKSAVVQKVAAAL